MGPQNLPLHIREVRARIAQAAFACGRSAHSVTLLAVSKAQPPEMIAAAADAGVREFGESYLTEALGKIAALQDRGLTWHFVGRLQANKTREIAAHFAWVHALERLKIAERLSAQRPPHLPPLQACLQVNLAGEASKAGVTAQELPALAAAVAALPRLTLRGLMCLPPPEQEPARQRHWFAQLRLLRDGLVAQGLALDTLSMGMSDDFESAIAEGATIVRLGTVLFGPRLRTISP
jgi:pyridoxal phosphate enzyme (YggS family)